MNLHTLGWTEDNGLELFTLGWFVPEIAIDDDDTFFPSTFTLGFGNTFTDTYVESFNT